MTCFESQPYPTEEGKPGEVRPVTKEEAMPMPYQNLLDVITAKCEEIFGTKLVGVYLHGSLAMGCFNPDKSDIDLIIVVEGDISDRQKLIFMESIVGLNEKAPAKGLELSVVKRKYCKPFLYPTPFELHFSPAHLKWFHDAPQNYIENMKGEDKDLAAHFTVINKYGIALYGETVEDVFALVPRDDYMDSIYADIENAEQDILSDPVYIILNLCRVLAFLEDGLCLSKKGGGEWGIKHLPDGQRTVISEALECYATDKAMETDKNMACQFARDMINLVRQEIG